MSANDPKRTVELAAAYEARTAKYEKRCFFATTTAMTSGTARNAPNAPHIQAQKAIDKKTRKGFRVRRCPMIMGVMICPSKVVTTIQMTGATSASVRSSEGSRGQLQRARPLLSLDRIGNETQRACENTQPVFGVTMFASSRFFSARDNHDLELSQDCCVWTTQASSLDGSHRRRK